MKRAAPIALEVQVDDACGAGGASAGRPAKRGASSGPARAEPLGDLTALGDTLDVVVGSLSPRSRRRLAWSCRGARDLVRSVDERTRLLAERGFARGGGGERRPNHPRAFAAPRGTQAIAALDGGLAVAAVGLNAHLSPGARVFAAAARTEDLLFGAPVPVGGPRAASVEAIAGAGPSALRVLVREHPGGGGGRWGLWEIRREGARLARVPAEEIARGASADRERPSLAASGRFARFDEEAGELRVTPAGERGERALGGFPAGFGRTSIEWDPEGARLLLVRGTQGTGATAWVVDAETGGRVRADAELRPGPQTPPAWGDRERPGARLVPLLVSEVPGPLQSVAAPPERPGWYVQDALGPETLHVGAGGAVTRCGALSIPRGTLLGGGRRIVAHWTPDDERAECARVREDPRTGRPRVLIDKVRFESVLPDRKLLECRWMRRSADVTLAWACLGGGRALLMQRERGALYDRWCAGDDAFGAPHAPACWLSIVRFNRG